MSRFATGIAPGAPRYDGQRRAGLGGRVVDSDDFAHARLDFDRQFGMLLQVFARIVLALADLVLVIGIPGAGLLDDAVFDAELNDFALARYAFAVENVEQGSRNGGAILFFTTFTRVSLPITSSFFLIDPMRRMSSRTERRT